MTLYHPDSVPMSSVGDDYVVAIGYEDPGSGLTRMVGYCLTPTGQWVESTNMQDEQHLVQIASPASSDKFTRFPKVSQGDWSGGERQLIYVNQNQYYSSTMLNTANPGHLFIVGAYTQVTLPHDIISVAPRAMAADSLSSFAVLNSNSAVAKIDHLSLAVSSITTGGNPNEIIRGGDAMYFLRAPATGAWQITDGGSVVQVTDDAVEGQGATLAYFGGSIWYALASPAYQLNSATYAFPGAGAGTTAVTMPQMETAITTVCDSATGLVVVTGDRTNGQFSYIYSFDGVNATFLGAVSGFVYDSVQANGTVYLLANSGIGTTTNAQALPIIYEVVGSVVSVFDDFRLVDPAFQPPPTPFTITVGHLASDGVYLYLFYPGLSVKRYLLRTGAIYDVGDPFFVTSPGQSHHGTPTIQGGFIEGIEGNPHLFSMQPLVASNADGSMITSWYDDNTPDVDKSFKSIEFAFNTPFTQVSVTVQYQIDNPNTGFHNLSLAVTQSGLGLVGFFPVGTIGKRVRYNITISHFDDVDIQLWSTLMTLARIWTFPVSCRRDPQTLKLHDDPQGLLAIQLIANIENAYLLAAGKVTMWIPDATATPDNPTLDPVTGSPVIGVSEVQAVLQDYQKSTAPGVAPGYRQNEAGVWDLEGDVALTIAESLG